MKSLLILVLMCSSLAQAQQTVVVYGDSSYPPYSYSADSKPEGIYVDIVERAFSMMNGYTLRFQMTPWQRGLNAVKSGRAIALFPPYRTEARESWMAFSDPILGEEIVVFTTAKTLEGKSVWPDDFHGLTCGMNAGFDLAGLGGQKFADAVKAGKIRIHETKGTEANLRKLVKGRVDVYLNDRLTDVSDYPSIVRGMVTSTNHGHLGFTRASEAFPYLDDLRQRFNKAIEELKSSGEIEKILAKYRDQD